MTIFASNDSGVQAKSVKSNIFMKKHYSLLLAFLVAFSSFFVSCDENDNDLNPTFARLQLLAMVTAQFPLPITLVHP